MLRIGMLNSIMTEKIIIYRRHRQLYGHFTILLFGLLADTTLGLLPAEAKTRPYWYKDVWVISCFRVHSCKFVHLFIGGHGTRLFHNIPWNKYIFPTYFTFRSRIELFLHAIRIIKISY